MCTLSNFYPFFRKSFFKKRKLRKPKTKPPTKPYHETTELLNSQSQVVYQYLALFSGKYSTTRMGNFLLQKMKKTKPGMETASDRQWPETETQGAGCVLPGTSELE